MQMATTSSGSKAFTQMPSNQELALISVAATTATITTASVNIGSHGLPSSQQPAAAENGETVALIQCPNCDLKLHRYEVAAHCEQEMQRLKEMSTKTAAVADIAADVNDSTEVAEEAGSTSTNGQSATDRRKPWTVFQRVQRNRQSRMKQRTRKRPATATEHPCPVCNQHFPHDEIQQHAESCLRRSNRTANGRSNSDDHSSNEGDADAGEEYEEYEWAGQKRIRVSSLLQGGYAAIGIGQATTNGSSSGHSRLNGHANGSLAGQHNDEDDEDLNVDEDDTEIYGPAQYEESDVIPSHIMNEDESDVTSYMRRLITAGSNTNRETNTTTTDSLGLSSCTGNSEISAEPIVAAEDAAATPSTPAHYQQIIDSLKAKLRHYEQQNVPGKYKCLICLDDYRNPAISVACWHVHCEQCWLRSLGARKLCPQCNLITTPKDLRRIYM